jgi:hypothetical protein
VKHLVWIAVLVGLTQMPAAYAQQNAAIPPGYAPGPLDPGNRGTPDAPKACRSTTPRMHYCVIIIQAISRATIGRL